MSPYVPLAECAEEAVFGGKAAGLARALAAGWPVPDGFAIAADVVEQIEAGHEPTLEAVHTAHRAHSLESTPVAVRSSAIGEDSTAASFAGQHLTVLHVLSAEATVTSVRQVWRSARSEAALAYRERLGIAGAPRIAAVVQRMLQPEVAGVLFTRDPMDGSDRRVVEATWGLGEAVVSGIVTPDRYTWGRGGAGLEVFVGEKDVEIGAKPGGGTEELDVPADRVFARCLDDAALDAIEALVALVEGSASGAHDIEFAFEGGRLYLLQRRAVTR